MMRYNANLQSMPCVDILGLLSVGELLFGFQDVAFLPCRTSFHTACLEICG